MLRMRCDEGLYRSFCIIHFLCDCHMLSIVFNAGVTASAHRGQLRSLCRRHRGCECAAATEYYGKQQPSRPGKIFRTWLERRSQQSQGLRMSTVQVSPLNHDHGFYKTVTWVSEWRVVLQFLAWIYSFAILIQV